MTVGAVMGVYQYTGVYQAQFLPSTITNDQLNALMRQYGIKQTGDEYTDIKALYEAMYQDIARSGATQGVKTENQMEQIYPWASLMKQLGLGATGDFSKDYSVFMNALNTQQAAAKTPAEKSRLNLIQRMAQVVFVQPQQKEQANKIMQLTGSEIIAQMNRTALLS